MQPAPVVSSSDPTASTSASASASSGVLVSMVNYSPLMAPSPPPLPGYRLEAPSYQYMSYRTAGSRFDTRSALIAMVSWFFVFTPMAVALGAVGWWHHADDPNFYSRVGLFQRCDDRPGVPTICYRPCSTGQSAIDDSSACMEIGAVAALCVLVVIISGIGFLAMIPLWRGYDLGAGFIRKISSIFAVFVIIFLGVIIKLATAVVDVWSVTLYFCFWLIVPSMLAAVLNLVVLTRYAIKQYHV